MTVSKRTLLIGFGNMGRALVSGWMAQGRPKASIEVVDADAAALAAAERMGLPVRASVRESTEPPEVVVLAVKPGQLDEAARPCAVWAGTRCVFLSIAAGKTIARLRAALGPEAAVVRAMPNTPAAIGRGMTGLCAGAGVDDAQKTLCGELMAAVGDVEWIADETLMDAVTAVSGSGPAYVFLLIECLTAAGVAAGLDEEVAARLARATVAGSGAYAVQSGLGAAELRRRVTSPNGTTAAALDVLMDERGLAPLVAEAVAAAAKRSRQLSDE